MAPVHIVVLARVKRKLAKHTDYQLRIVYIASSFAIAIAPAFAMTVNLVPSGVSVVARAALGSPDEPAIPALTTLLANVET